MPIHLKNIIPKRLTLRIFLVVFIIFTTIISLSFTRNLLYITNKNIEINLLHTSINYNKSLEKIINYLNEATFLSKTIAQKLAKINKIPKQQRRKYFNEYMHKILSQNGKLLAIWVITKPYTIDSLDNYYKNKFINYNGEYIQALYRGKFKIYQDSFAINYYKDLNKYLKIFKKNHQNLYIDAPRDVTYSLARSDFRISIVSAVYKKNKIIGVVGVDIPISLLDKYLRNKPYNFWIVDQNNKFVYAINHSKIKKNLINYYPELIPPNSLLYNYVIDKKLIDHYTEFNLHSKKYYIFFGKIKILDINPKWIYAIEIPKKNILKNSLKQNITFFIPFIISLISFIIILYLIARILNNYINKIDKQLTFIAEGKYQNIQNKEYKWHTIELKKLQENINKITARTLKAAEIAQYLAQNKYDIEISDKDPLSLSLKKLQEVLVKNQKEQEEYRKKQEQERWFTNAINQVNTILRKYIEKETFSQQILNFVVNYVNAVQGGFFTLETDENNNEYLSLIAFYSYGREVYHRKKIQKGDGLIGSCAQEKKPIFTTVPENYIEITSGLGKAKPNYLYISPLIHENNVYGVLELTFLQKPKKESLELINEISTIVASTLSSVKISEETKKLLQQAHKTEQLLIKREEELKKAIEEIDKLKGEKETQKEKLRAISSALNEVAFFIEFDTNLNIISINKYALEKLSIPYTSALSSDYYLIFGITEIIKHQKYIKKVLNGEKQVYEFSIKTAKQAEFWIKSILTPIFNEKNKVVSFLFLGIDYTEIMKLKKQIEQMQLTISEQKEQLSIQEMEFDSFSLELQQMEEEIENKNQQIETLIQEKEKLEKSLEFFKKELEKRINRSKKIEQTLKNKNKQLQEYIHKLEEELKKYKK